MRISNPMITNTMLLNINRNVNMINDYYNQVTTGKRIQTPSDDPIVAARALKFRTTVRETQQYQKNVEQGMSWMEVTENGFNNVTEIMKKIRELCVQGATDSMGYDDRKKIAGDIKSMTEQLGVEMNITYAGRYVFSGYKTDKPPILDKDSTETYNISQTFYSSDIQDTKSYQKLDKDEEPVTEDIKIIKLPYNNVTDLSVAGFTVNKIPADTDGAYNEPDPGKITYIPETGELVINKADVNRFSDGIKVNYKASNLKKGDLNPEVYFKENSNGQVLEYEFGVNTKIGINSLAKDVYTDKMYADLKNFIELIENVEVSNEAELENKFAHLTGDALKEAVTEQTTKEKQTLQGILQDRFDDMLKIIDEHDKVISKEYADLGSRMNRLELIQKRLEEDEITYTTLLSQNEDTDYMTTLMYLKSATSVYEASLQIGSNVIQTTLANFIR